LVSGKKIDAAVMRKYGGLRHVPIRAKPPSKNPIKFFTFAASQLLAFIGCILLLKRERINCVIGMGGFTSIPAVFAAFVLGKSIIIHESNRIPGKSTRLLAHLADIIFLPPGISLGGKSLAKKTIHVAVPLRKEIYGMDRRTARENLQLQLNMPTVVVLGGSQGADALNLWAYSAFRDLNAHGIALCCVRGILAEKREIVIGKSSGGEDIANVFMPFCDDMRSLLNAADLIVCRAGAVTIAEAAALSIPMVLVPYPNAADGHQLANATHAASIGIATVVLQENISDLGKIVLKYFQKNPKGTCAAVVSERERSSAMEIAEYAERIIHE
jgi:UDP-N-acetylglucosamine--N-acetylmuramyl-(pentapeptide) pyrophosphoryl-undecaprenol N-acetylglucosamine transferase